MRKSILLLGSQGNVGKGILQSAKLRGYTVAEFDKKKGNDIKDLTISHLTKLTQNINEIVYTAECGNRDEYERNPSLSSQNKRIFKHFCTLASNLKKKIRIHYIGGSWTKRRIPKDFIVKDNTPNKTKEDNPNPYELAKIDAENHAKSLVDGLELNIIFYDWISIVPNYSENFTINKFVKEAITTGQVSYTPGSYGRPLLATHNAGEALLIYIEKYPSFKESSFKKLLIPGIFISFEELAKVVQYEIKKQKNIKVVLEEREDTPPSFLKAKVESKFFSSIGFRTSKKALKKALDENVQFSCR